MEANVSSLWLTSPGPSPVKAKADLGAVMDRVQVIFYTVVCVGGSLGNGLVIWLTARRAGRSINCVWFLNLAVADFIFSVTRVVPLAKNAFYRGHWPFGVFLCRATSFTKYLNMFCSLFLLAAISLDRLAAVAFPVWSRNRRGPRLAWAAAAGAWGAAAAASLPFYLYRNLVPEGKASGLKCSLTLGEGPKLTLYLLRLLCGFLAPFAIILACYGALAAMLRGRPATVRSRKPFKVMAAIVVTFFLCWAPTTSSSSSSWQASRARPWPWGCRWPPPWPISTAAPTPSSTSSWGWTSAGRWAAPPWPGPSAGPCWRMQATPPGPTARGSRQPPPWTGWPRARWPPTWL
ncbi:unnamed protein product, partial [Natator depressus]